MSVSIVDLNSA